MTPSAIGRYQIRAEIGRGGMATVFRAHDPRFGRDVALKVLPHALMHDPTFRTRFDREARTIAALEHPAIVPVYDFGENDGQPYLVMRLMTGGSLSERLRHGPLPLDEAATILQRIGAALDKAHERGIIHRDLKPGNILFDQEGNAYLSDFGIAKISESTVAVTGSNIVGTPAYMSPEQAQGEGRIDGRSDIYALGAILFQLLTGRLPYQADTPMGIVVKHITEPVPLIRKLRPDLPAGCDQVIGTAMAKHPQDRFASAAAMSQALNAALSGQRLPAPSPRAKRGETIGFEPWQAPEPVSAVDDWPEGDWGTEFSPPTEFGRRSGLPTWLWVMGGLLALGVVTGVAIGAFVLIFLNQDATPTPVPQPPAVVTSGDTTPAVTEVPVSAITPTTLTPELTLSPTSDALGPTPSSAPPAGTRQNGRIVFDSTRGNIAAEVYVMNSDGSGQTRLTNNSDQDDEPDLSPDGRFIAYETRGSDGVWTIIVMGSDGSTPVAVATDARQPAWSPDGQLIAYETADDQQIWLLEYPGGQARQITRDSHPNRAPSWSPDGRELVVMAELNGVWQLVAIDAGTGVQRRITSGDEDKRFPAWSPEGDLIAYNTIESGNADQIWLVGADGANPRQVTQSGHNGRVAWSPDGSFLLFNSDRGGPWLIYRVNLDGSNVEPLTSIGNDQRPDWGA